MQQSSRGSNRVSDIKEEMIVGLKSKYKDNQNVLGGFRGELLLQYNIA